MGNFKFFDAREMNETGNKKFITLVNKVPEIIYFSLGIMNDEKVKPNFKDKKRALVGVDWDKKQVVVKPVKYNKKAFVMHRGGPERDDGKLSPLKISNKELVEKIAKISNQPKSTLYRYPAHWGEDNEGLIIDLKTILYKKNSLSDG
ncbi:MAG: hypothetical protein ACOCT9_00360 [archaeon]